MKEAQDAKERMLSGNPCPNLDKGKSQDKLADKSKVSKEARLGELLVNTSKVPLQEPSKGKGSLKGSKPYLPIGINKKETKK